MFHVFLGYACTGKDDFGPSGFFPWYDGSEKFIARAPAQCCMVTCRQHLASRGISCGAGSGTGGWGARSPADWEDTSDDESKKLCCKAGAQRCTKGDDYGKWEKRAAVLNDVTYLENWGKSIIKAKNDVVSSYVHACKQNNKKYATPQECAEKYAFCCHQCESRDCSTMPLLSTCKDQKASESMKKNGGGEKCSSAGEIHFEMQSKDWYVCALGLTLIGNFSKGG